MSMNPYHLSRKFIVWILTIHSLFATVMFGILIWVQAIPLKAGSIVGALLFIFSAPTTTLVALWLAKRSNWRDGLVTTRVACRRAGYIYGAFAGAILGAHYWGNTGAIALGLALFFAGWFGGSQIGVFVWARIKLSIPSEA